MQNQKDESSQAIFNKKNDEKILVVSKHKLFSHEAFNGIKSIDFDRYQKVIEMHKKFMWRSEIETNENYKQIIPYLIFTSNNKYFLMQRKNEASEVRLRNKCSLGIGGHIKEEDLSKTNISGWSEREFHEEVSYKGKLKIEPVGILNDENDEVGRVHTGFVFLLHGNSEKIEIRDEHKSGVLLTLQECKNFYNRMERWSQIVFNYLKTRH
jgi:predicted NUDIX family phosphoesterase